MMLQVTGLTKIFGGLRAVDHADLRAVYNNLLRASQNHLRAFSRQLP